MGWGQIVKGLSLQARSLFYWWHGAMQVLGGVWMTHAVYCGGAGGDLYWTVVRDLKTSERFSSKSAQYEVALNFCCFWGNTTDSVLIISHYTSQVKIRFAPALTLFCFLGGSDGKKKIFTCNAGDPGSIPGSERSPGEGNGNPLKYSCMGNSVDRGAWWATIHGVVRVGHNLVTKPSPSLYSQLKNPSLLRPVTRQGIKKAHTSEKTFVFGNPCEVHKHFLLLLEYTCFTMFC